MKSLGARKLDPLGRITLPKELRRTLGLVAGVKVDMWTDKNSICIKLFDQNNPKGISRPIDDLGRITIPKEFRTSFQIKEREKLNINLDGPIIYLEVDAKCVFCGTDEKNILIEMSGKHICLSCLETLIEEVRE